MNLLGATAASSFRFIHLRNICCTQAWVQRIRQSREDKTKQKNAKSS